MTTFHAEAVPVRRPQLRREGNDVYFLISRRPLASLTDAQCAVWDAIDGMTPVGALESEQPGALAIVEELHEKRLIEVVDVVVPSGSDHLVVVEPHMDDAILSLGATLLRRRGRVRTTILTLFGRSNFTSYRTVPKDYLDVETITRLRRAESSLTARLVGAEHVALDFEERSLAFAEPADWTFENLRRFGPVLSMATTHPVMEADVRLLQEPLERELESLGATEVLFPMGLGRHGDHAATREACLRVARECSRRGTRVRWAMYEDIPYRNRYPRHASTILNAFDDASASMRTEELPLGDLELGKLRLLEVFGSQFKVNAMRDEILGATRGAEVPVTAIEVLHHFDRLPETVPPLRTHHRAEALLSLGRDVARFRQRYADAKHILVVSMLPFGRIDAGVELLEAAFPAAGVDIVLPKRAEWEAETHAKSSRRTRIHIAQSSMDWSRKILGHVFRRTPVFSCLPTNGGRAASAVRTILAAQPHVQCESPSELSAVLEAELSRSSVPAQAGSNGVF